MEIITEPGPLALGDPAPSINVVPIADLDEPDKPNTIAVVFFAEDGAEAGAKLSIEEAAELRAKLSEILDMPL